MTRNGFYTFATIRNIEGGGSKQIIDIAKNGNWPLQIIQLDVNNDKPVSNAINRIISEKNGIDIVVNNAGYDLMGALEESSTDEIKVQFEINFFGAIRVIQAVIPVMRKQRGGIIVNITSLCRAIYFPLNSSYHAAKFTRGFI